MYRSLLVVTALFLQSALSFNVSAQEVSTIFTGKSPGGLAVDNAQNVYFSVTNEKKLYKLAPGGTPVVFSTTHTKPLRLVFDSAGAVESSGLFRSGTGQAPASGSHFVMIRIYSM